VDYKRVRDVTAELPDMGCYELSMGDTTGTGNPTSAGEMLSAALGANPVEKLAGNAYVAPSFVASPFSQLKTSRICCLSDP